jgi:hypothetical protein
VFVTHPPYLRDKARQMRVEKKLSIDEIAERLVLPKTTIFGWVRDLPLARPRATRGQAAGTHAMRRKYRLLREAAYERGRREFDELGRDPLFRDFVCMYIGEGYKRNRNRVSLGNSDAAVIRLANRWIRRFSRNLVSYSVQYHADQDLHELCRFWAKQLGISPEEIRLQRKSNSNRLSGRTWRSEHGVLTVCTDDTLLRARLQAWIDRVEAQWIDSVPIGA